MQRKGDPRKSETGKPPGPETQIDKAGSFGGSQVPNWKPRGRTGARREAGAAREIGVGGRRKEALRRSRDGARAGRCGDDGAIELVRGGGPKHDSPFHGGHLLSPMGHII